MIYIEDFNQIRSRNKLTTILKSRWLHQFQNSTESVAIAKKPGHMTRDCRKKKAEQNKSQNNAPKSLRPCRHCGRNHMDK
jgi:hypothetical protein